MEWLWLGAIIPIAFLWLVIVGFRAKPTVAEVHSWAEGQNYRMVLILNGSDLVLRAGLRLPNGRAATAREAAAAMMDVLAHRVRFTARTVYIPEGPLGLNAAPA